MKLTLSPRKTSKTLFIIYLVLLVLNIFSIYLIYNYQFTYTQSAVREFNFDRENNFPTIFSAINLGISGFLFFLIGNFKKKENNKSFRYWYVLSFVFFFLMIDEITALHEILINTSRTLFSAEGYFYFAWVIPYSIISIIGILVFSKFFYNLPRKTLYLLIFSAIIFFTGAVGMEMVGGNFADSLNEKHSYTMGYMVSYTIEESLEMLGVILLIYTLLDYLVIQKLQTVKLEITSD